MNYQMHRRKAFQQVDDAMAYILAVEAADGQALEDGVKVAISNFVVGCKSDGIWAAIKSCCILAGARTLTGALVPLVGTAPTNFNFVSGDYNRKTGLLGNASTKYLDSNRAGNADPQNNFHVSTYSTTPHNPSTVAGLAGGANIGNGGATTTGASHLGISGGSNPADYKTFTRNRSNTSDSIGPDRTSITFQGMTRSSSTGYSVRVAGLSYSLVRTSQVPSASNILVFCRNNGGPELLSNGRIAFYSIGESLDLSLLEARLVALINAISAAIP